MLEGDEIMSPALFGDKTTFHLLDGLLPFQEV